MIFEKYYDYGKMAEQLGALSRKYGFIEYTSLGRKTILGREIPLISLGEGERSVIYVGAHHGSEWISSAVLVKFLDELCRAHERDGCVGDVRCRTLLRLRRLYIVPMLNPDGVDYAVRGVDKENALRERVLRMNGERGDDFSHWQANARGVDLNHNYPLGFCEYKKIEEALGIPCGAPSKYSGAHPESEPEVSAMCDFVRMTRPALALTLHTQGEEIFCTSGGRYASGSKKIAEAISALTGYRLSVPEGTAAYGGFTDWFIDELDSPSLTLECGKGENPLPLSELDSIYGRLRIALFKAPTLV